jgi:hypothetical protein
MGIYTHSSSSNHPGLAILEPVLAARPVATLPQLLVWLQQGPCLLQLPVLAAKLNSLADGVSAAAATDGSAYVTKLSQIRRGPAAELCMKMRLESLPLRAIHSCQRRNETTVQHTQRESCPACHSAPETLAHFLLQSPAYSACRTTLFNKLQETVPATLAAIQAGPPAHTWRVLLTDDVLGNDEPARPAGAEREDASAVIAMRAVADFVCEIWKLRNTVLTRRGTNEGNLMV